MSDLASLASRSIRRSRRSLNLNLNAALLSINLNSGTESEASVAFTFWPARLASSAESCGEAAGQTHRQTGIKTDRQPVEQPDEVMVFESATWPPAANVETLRSRCCNARKVLCCDRCSLQRRTFAVLLFCCSEAAQETLQNSESASALSLLGLLAISFLKLPKPISRNTQNRRISPLSFLLMPIRTKLVTCKIIGAQRLFISTTEAVITRHFRRRGPNYWTTNTS